ncbi:MAG: hypothetical protein RL071_2045 [Pseudomonadota bacterium]
MDHSDWSSISPLISRMDTTGRTVRVTFRCAVTGEEQVAQANIPMEDGVGARVGRTVQRSLLYSVQGAISSAIRSAFGHGMVGRIAGDAAYGLMSEATRSSGATVGALSQADKQRGAELAFATVRHRFAWDPGRGGWVSAKVAQEVLGAFELRLQQHAPSHPYDRLIMARMLVEVARADGRLAETEQDWLGDSISADVGSVAELAARPVLTAAELGACSPGAVRETLLMMAWTMALLDEDLQASEKSLLDRFAQGLGLHAAKAEEAKRMAQNYILDNAMERMLTWGGHDSHARGQVEELARRLGMSAQQGQEAEARALRRMSTRR